MARARRSTERRKSAAPIPLATPVIRGNEWVYVKECLDTGWVSSVGSYVTRFEEAVAGHLGAKYAVATASGTASLHASLVACGVGPGDEVIVPVLTFVAPANAVRYCGAEPVFMDCDPGTLCIDARKTEDFLRRETRRGKRGRTYNKTSGACIKALIPVHVFGHPADMDPLVRICREHAIDIIEDATESLGSAYKGTATGVFGRAGCLSFNGNKIITTGGGGMVVTGDERLAARVRHLTTQAKSDPFEYDHDAVGYNYRLNNVQAAIGVAQMEQLDSYVAAKRKNAALYAKLLKGLEGLSFLEEQPWARSNRWFYAIRVDDKRDKDPLMRLLLKRRIQVRPVWKLLNTLPMYRKSQAYRIERAKEAYETCINIPCSVDLTTAGVHTVVDGIRRYFDRKGAA